MLLPLGFGSCEKPMEYYDELVDYYYESKTLDAVTRDSVVRFQQKLINFIKRHPEAQNDSLYTEIRHKVFIILDYDSWGEDINITFGGSANGGSTATGGSTAADSTNVSPGNIDIDTTWAGYTYIQF